MSKFIWAAGLAILAGLFLLPLGPVVFVPVQVAVMLWWLEGYPHIRKDD